MIPVANFINGGGDCMGICAGSYYLSNICRSAGRENITNFISAGDWRTYLGICAGYWYTMAGYYWEGNYYWYDNLLTRINPGESWTHGLINSYPAFA
jgi:glutamine amidotransferase-like uncharacterized protein